MATAASGRPWRRTHGLRHVRNGKTQNKHSPWAHGDSPGLSDREKI